MLSSSSYPQSCQKEWKENEMKWKSSLNCLKKVCIGKDAIRILMMEMPMHCFFSFSYSSLDCQSIEQHLSVRISINVYGTELSAVHNRVTSWNNAMLLLMHENAIRASWL